MTSGRHALVCGASAGIGRATALALASRGATVTVLARSADKLTVLAEELRTAGAAAAFTLTADQNDRPALAAVVEEHLDANGPVHILVNNSGGPPPGPILEASADDFLLAFGRHVLVNHLLVRLVLPGMREASWGRIVNVVSSSVREPIPGLGVSNTIRGAVASWAKTVSRELPPGITINNVLPGLVATQRLSSLMASRAEDLGMPVEDVTRQWQSEIPEGRIGRVEELAETIAFLASDEASYIRGVSLPVDGGRLRSI